ncbi:hypothetical protein D3C76_1494100 [compost metagenome]
MQQADADIELIPPEALCHDENFIANGEQVSGGDGCVAPAHGDNGQQGVFIHCHDVTGPFPEGQRKELADGSQELMVVMGRGSRICMRIKCVLHLQMDPEIILQVQTQLL